MERRDSKGTSKSQQNRQNHQNNNKSRGNNNKGSNGHEGGNNDGESKPQKSYQGGKSHGGSSNMALVRTKPCREIYRPPSLRKGRGDSVSRDETKANGSSGNFYNMQDYKPGGNNHPPIYHHSNSVPSSPLVTRNNVGNNGGGGGINRGGSFNVNAKEFQLAQQAQQLNFALGAQGNPPNQNFYGASPILASSGCYPLKQSKSSGNMNILLQHQQGQNYPLMASLNQAASLGFSFGQQINLHILQQQQQQQQRPGILVMGAQQQDSQNFNRLQQSKSSGSIPGSTKPRVRFDDGGSNKSGGSQQRKNRNNADADSDDDFDERISMRVVGNELSSLSLNGESMFSAKTTTPCASTTSITTTTHHTQQKPIQKSRTSFSLNLSNLPTQLSPTKQSSYVPNDLTASPNTTTAGASNYSNVGCVAIKRSKSFASGSARSSTSAPISSSSLIGTSTYADFQISRWPRSVQESVTTAVTGVDRVPARHRIDMVNRIFDAMLQSATAESEDKSLETEKQDLQNEKQEINYMENIDDIDLTSAAVHIFLYFIQREKDRTVLESLLNTCFATFQTMKNLSSSNATNPKQSANGTQKEMFSDKWIRFLRFLSHLYAKVKMIRMQQSQTQLKTMDEMSFTLLALLCDSCLATLRSPLSYTPQSMDCLFTVLTSIGRDMESTFPLKMKQLLAAVRDALLGLGPYSNPLPLSQIVQKTLMQLIELHAANWHLPASAVRYYYTNPAALSAHHQNHSSSQTNSNSPPDNLQKTTTPTKPETRSIAN